MEYQNLVGPKIPMIDMYGLVWRQGLSVREPRVRTYCWLFALLRLAIPWSDGSAYQMKAEEDNCAVFRW